MELKKGVEGLVHISNISREHIQTPSEKVKVGDMVKVKILDVDGSSRKIRLSIKDAEEKSERVTRDENAKMKLGDEEPSFTVGDRYKEILSNIR